MRLVGRRVHPGSLGFFQGVVGLIRVFGLIRERPGIRRIFPGLLVCDMGVVGFME